MLVAFSVLPGIWIVRNYCHYRRFSLTSNGGYNLLYANAAAVIGDEQHTTWDIERLRLARDFTSKLATDTIEHVPRLVEIPSGSHITLGNSFCCVNLFR